MREIRQLIGLMFGILTVTIITGSIWIASVRSPDFLFFRDWISDLGDGPGAAVFNMGLMVGCVFGVLFSFLGLGRVLKHSLSRDIGTMMMSIACVFGILVGIFPITYPDEHTVAAYGAFISLGVALLFVSYSLGLDDPLGKRTTEFTKSVFVIYLILFIVAPNPIGETLSLLVLGIWIVLFSMVGLRGIVIKETHPQSDGQADSSQV